MDSQSLAADVREVAHDVVGINLNPNAPTTTVAKFCEAQQKFAVLYSRNFDTTKLGFAAALFAADIPKQIYTGWHPNLPFATKAVKDDAIVSVQFACDWSSHYKELDIEGMKTKCLRQQARPCTRR